MPEHYFYFTGSRRVEIIQFQLDKFRQEFKTENKVLETLKNKGVQGNFPKIVSVMQSELENLGEIMVIQEGRNLFSEFDLVQTFRNPASHKKIELKLIN